VKEGGGYRADEAKGNEDNYDEGTLKKTGRACGCFPVHRSSGINTPHL
jgi:hypothetical protein